MGKIQIKTLEIAGLGSVLEALRLPYGKEARSEFIFHGSLNEDYEKPMFQTESNVYIDERDLRLLSTLVKRGEEHAKVLRSMMVWAEISAPVWFYRELETYRIGRERLASTSTMHIECKGLQGEELEKAKDEIPMGHVQKTIDMFSYQTLRRIYFQRRNHRLPMWHDFCSWIESLPFSDLLITIERE